VPDNIDFFYVGGTRATAEFNQASFVQTPPFAYAAVPFDVEAGRDAVIVAVAYTTTVGSAVTGCTIGGSAATLIATTPEDASRKLDFYLASPSGTSGTISFSHVGSPAFSAMGCWSAYGLKSLTPLDTQSGMGAQSIAAHTRGFVLAGAADQAPAGVAWTVSGLTQDGADQVMTGIGTFHSRIFLRSSSPGATLSYSVISSSTFAPDDRCLAISMR
jgi:hypothetical protein